MTSALAEGRFRKLLVEGFLEADAKTSSNIACATSILRPFCAPIYGSAANDPGIFANRPDI